MSVFSVSVGRCESGNDRARTLCSFCGRDTPLLFTWLPSMIFHGLCVGECVVRFARYLYTQLTKNAVVTESNKELVTEVHAREFDVWCCGLIGAHVCNFVRLMPA